MFINTLDIKNFRIFKKKEFNFSNDINILYGLNGQGKTSVIEAVYYLSLTRSFKTGAKDQAVLRKENNYFEISGAYQNKNNTRLFFSLDKGKHIFVNDIKIEKFSDYIGQIPIVVLTLENQELIYGYPKLRRNFLDILISQVSSRYITNLQRYKNIIFSKNKLLSELEPNIELLKSYNDLIVQYGNEIVLQRIELVTFFNTNIKRNFNAISGKNENPSIKYKIKNSNLDVDNNLDIIQVLRTLQEKYFTKEIQYHKSLYGPHLDDIIFYLDDIPIKNYSSQGENKSYLIALKNIEREFILLKKNQNPIFLLDDVFGELDTDRTENLLYLIKDKGQTIITTTNSTIIETSYLKKNNCIHLDQKTL